METSSTRAKVLLTKAASPPLVLTAQRSPNLDTVARWPSSGNASPMSNSRCSTTSERFFFLENGDDVGGSDAVDFAVGEPVSGANSLRSWTDKIMGLVSSKDEAQDDMQESRSSDYAQNYSTVNHMQSKSAPERLSASLEDIDSTDKMRTKLLSIWNNVKFSWSTKMKTNFSKTEPICLLGRFYDQRMTPDLSGYQASEENRAWIEAFQSDFQTKIWMTYRQDIPVIRDSTYTSDCGWGCMLRSGQMMFGQALLCHLLGRDWRWKEKIENCRDHILEEKHRMILRWLGDYPGRENPFSIHKLVALGEKSGKKAGDWYGPAAVAHLLKQALEQSAYYHADLEDICIYVAQDCTVSTKDLYDLCRKNSVVQPGPMSLEDTSGVSQSFVIVDKPYCDIPERLGVERPRASRSTDWKACVILVPTRLGTERLNIAYADAIFQFLALESCIGIIGGRPKHSLYFVGCQEEKLIYLDPHYCQDNVDVRRPSFPVDTYHCHSPRKLSINKMDPSCCIGFYCRTQEDLEQLIHETEKIQKSCPIFIFNDARKRDRDLPSMPDEDFSSFTWPNDEDDSFDSEIVILS